MPNSNESGKPTQHEDFLAHKPLNERLERLSQGDDEDEMESPVGTAGSNAYVGRAGGGNRPLDDNDREDLRRLTLEPGWATLLKMIDNRTKTLEDDANTHSKRNPFSSENASNWAMVSMREKIRDEIVAMLQAEISILQSNKAKDTE